MKVGDEVTFVFAQDVVYPMRIDAAAHLFVLSMVHEISLSLR
jgi:hypothetical protein